MSLRNVLATTAGGLAGAGLALTTAKAYQNKTGKPFGVPASVTHIVSNNKIEDKKACVKEITKEGIKDSFVLAGSVATVGGATALATKFSPKFKGLLKQGKDFISSKLDNVILKGGKVVANGDGMKVIEDISLKNKIKDTKIFQKFNSLPAPVKAGIAVATAALAVLAPTIATINAQKTGYIEGQHESK